MVVIKITGEDRIRVLSGEKDYDVEYDAVKTSIGIRCRLTINGNELLGSIIEKSDDSEIYTVEEAKDRLKSIVSEIIAFLCFSSFKSNQDMAMIEINPTSLIASFHQMQR